MHNQEYTMTDIARHGQSMASRDFNKAACFEVFEQAVCNNGKLDLEQLAKLYRYFAPKLPAKPKNDFQWVAQAMGVKDVRHYLNFIYSDGIRLMATDGSRIHMIKNANYPAGYYDKNGNMVENQDFAKYPDIDRVIPETDKLTYFSTLKITAVEGKKEFAEVYDFEDIRICAKYLKQACQYFDNALINHSDKGAAVLIQDLNKLAIVMPMRK